MRELFFELLQVSLGTRDALSRVPSVGEWEALLAEAKRQAVVSVMLGGQDRLSQEIRPPKYVLLKWIAYTQMVENGILLHRQRAREVTELFEKEEYKTCILKGLSAAAYYPDPLRRQCGDIDLWALPSPNGDIRRKEIMRWLCGQYRIEKVLYHHAHVEVFPDVSVEAHFHPSWLYNPFHNAVLQRWLVTQGKLLNDSPKGEHGYVETPAAFDAVYLLVHAFHHVMESGVGIRHMVDIFYVMKRACREEKEEAYDTLCSFGMRGFVTAVMYVLQEACGFSLDEMLCAPNEKEGRFLLEEVLASGNFGQARRDGLVRNTLGRWLLLVRHYPSEVLWMLPWKVWHWGWRHFNRSR